MKSNSLLTFLITSIFIFNCGINKNKRVLNLESISPYEKCSDIVPLNDIENEAHSLKDLKNLSFSTAYTSIHTPYTIVSDSVEKDSIRYSYSIKIKDLVTIAFPKIELTNDKVLLSKNYQFIYKNLSSIYLNKQDEKSISNLIAKPLHSEKQLLINITSNIFRDRKSVTVRFYIFDLIEPKTLYKDIMSYDCDIRDYEALEKVISYGLLKLKENFE